jgi:hypothetical protein
MRSAFLANVLRVLRRIVPSGSVLAAALTLPVNGIAQPVRLTQLDHLTTVLAATYVANRCKFLSPQDQRRAFDDAEFLVKFVSSDYSGEHISQASSRAYEFSIQPRFTSCGTEARDFAQTGLAYGKAWASLHRPPPAKHQRP